MANAKRNEVELEVAGRRLKCKLTLTAIAEIEADCNIDFDDIALIFQAERAPIRIIRSLYLRGLEGAGMSYAEALATIDTLLDDASIEEVMPPAALIFRAVWKAADDVSGKDEGEAETPSEASPGNS